MRCIISFGPTARIYFNFFKDKALLVDYKSHESAPKRLSLKKLWEMISQTSNLSMDAETHTLLLRHMPKKDLINANLDTSDGADFSTQAWSRSHMLSRRR